MEKSLETWRQTAPVACERCGEMVHPEDTIFMGSVAGPRWCIDCADDVTDYDYQEAE